MIATQFSALPFLNNWRTKIIYFVLNPLINMALLVLIDMQYANSFNWSIVAASIAIDTTTLTMQTMNDLLVEDASLRIDFEMIAKKPFSFRYWMSKCITSAIIGTILLIINLVLALCFGAPLYLILRVVILLPLLCLTGIIFGFTAWAISWQMNDPYFLANFFSAIIQLVAGILVVITAYPTWLKSIALIFPFASPVTFIKTGSANLIASIIITLIWLLAGLIAYVIQIRPVLTKGKHRF